LRPHAFSPSDDSGFTIIEVMVAILILLVGVLGTVALIDGANRATSTTKAREGGVALTREVAEVSRLLDFDQFECVAETCVSSDKAIVALQAQPELADTVPGGAWTVERRGFTYTINVVQICKVDVAQDGINVALRATSGPFCSTGQATTGGVDNNPDDYRRLRVTVSWGFGNGTRQASQTALISNPTGGLGPRINCFGYGFAVAGPCTNPPPNPVVTSGNAVAFRAATTFAASLHWETDESTENDALGGPTAWTFDWDLKTVPGGPAGWPGAGFGCTGSAPFWVLDGTYLVSGQAFNDLGIPGQQRSANVVINRSRPAGPCGVAGGYNNRGLTGTPVIDLQWDGNKERDIVGYRVYRGSVSPANQVCPTNATGDPLTAGGFTSSSTPGGLTSCYVTPPAGTEQYIVVGVDCTATDQSCEGAESETPVSVPIDLVNQPPNQPTGVTASRSGTVVLVSWTPAATPDPDGDAIRYYRIYRSSGSSAYADRYATADCTPSGCVFQDNAPDAAKENYFVSAVDEKFSESAPVGPALP
jgi:prepilin-type N-terminal cleavage/methylation domain-containing protein